jgi:hypothetical protein
MWLTGYKRRRKIERKKNKDPFTYDMKGRQ